MKFVGSWRRCLCAALGSWLLPVAMAQGPVDFGAQPLPATWLAPALSRSVSFDMDSRHTGQRYRVVLGLPHKAAPSGGYPVLWALDGAASFPLMEVARPRPPSAGESAQWRQKVGEEPAGLVVAVG